MAIRNTLPGPDTFHTMAAEAAEAERWWAGLLAGLLVVYLCACQLAEVEPGNKVARCF